MSLGVAFALSPAKTEELLAIADDEDRDEWLQEHEEETEDADWFQYDKTWDELHRCLGDGELVIQEGPPLANAVFGSQPVMEDEDSSTFAGYLSAAEVPTVATALREVDKAWLRARFDRLDRTDYTTYGQPLSEDFFEHVWTCLEGLREFYAHAADRGASPGVHGQRMTPCRVVLRLHSGRRAATRRHRSLCLTARVASLASPGASAKPTGELKTTLAVNKLEPQAAVSTASWRSQSSMNSSLVDPH